MKILRSRAAVALTSAAALAMTATPALAQGWGGGWGGGRRHHSDDTGWIVGGLIGLITIGAIAASASNKNKNKRDRDYDYRDGRDYRDSGDYRDGRDYRDEAPRYGERRDDGNYRGYRQGYSSRGIDGAVDSCVGEVERGSTRVDSVDTVGRDGDGWRVEGRIAGGRPFACSVSGSGRIRTVTIDGRSAMFDGEEAAPADAG